MSESSDERSKRIFVTHLLAYPFKRQLSFFYQDLGVAQGELLEDGKVLRRRLARSFPSDVFLWRLVVRRIEGENRPFWTAYTTGEISREDLNRAVRGLGCFPKDRRISEEKLNSTARAIRVQRPHDLKAIFGDRKINRFHLMNRDSVDRIEPIAVPESSEVEECPF